MYQGSKSNPDNYSKLKAAYKAFDEVNLQSVGPMFLHYVVALIHGETDDFARFCSTRQIGEKYLAPVLMQEQMEEDMALDLG